ncbi:MAG: N-acetylmuramic acid 6-phosphate etherase [Acidobacteriota bacterium]
MNSETQTTLPITEQENPNTINLSSLPSQEIVRVMNEEDELVAAAIRQVLPEVARAVDGIVDRLSAGGRLFYVGTGTSGRLGVLDASEIPPTFGVPRDLVQAVIAGGYDACHRAVEASEDNATAGREDLKARDFGAGDALVGIAASGRTPYTIEALNYARELGAFTVALTCVPQSLITQEAEVSIVPVVGPEIIAGSTRLKAGSAQKMVLNMLSTAAMTRLGYVSGNRMTNVQAGNKKLQERAARILMAERGLSENDAARLLADAGDLRVALVMSATKCDAADARNALSTSSGVVKIAIEQLNKSPRP